MVNGLSLAVRVIWAFPTQSDTQFWSWSCRSGHAHWMDLDQQDGRRHLCCAFCRGGTGIWRYYGSIVFSRAGELTAEPRATVAVMYQSAVGWNVDAPNSKLCASRGPHHQCCCRTLPSPGTHVFAKRYQPEQCARNPKKLVFHSLMKYTARDWCPHDECVHRFSSASTVKGVCVPP